jgi:hypothetical protein
VIVSKNVTITDAATLIHKAATNGCKIYIYSADTGGDVTIGPASVVAGTGYVIPASKKTEVTIDIPPGDELYGIMASSSKTLHVTVVEF